jgi:hypothetical protein
MTAPAINPYEAVTYGSFAAGKIMEFLPHVDPEFAGALRHTVDLLVDATEAMATILKRTSEVEVEAYALKPGEPGPMARTRDVLERLVSYTNSRPGGRALAQQLLGAQPVSQLLRRKPAQVIPVIEAIIANVSANADKLPEHASWARELTVARDALARDQSARAAPPRERPMSGAIATVHAEWLKVYAATRLIVEGMLRMNGVAVPVQDIFADLMEARLRADD